MGAETEAKGIAINDGITGNKHDWKNLLYIYLVLFLCALFFTITCRGGILAAVRGLMLGSCMLLGIFTVKRFYQEGVNWKKRVGYSIPAGILSGLFAATVIWLLEIEIGSPTMSANPYTQNTSSLFFMCPLYGLFMLGTFALAFKLPWGFRFLIVWAGSALVSTLGLEELARSQEIDIYILGLFRNCYYYYLYGLINCFMFALLWTWGANVICRNKYVSKTSVKRKIISYAVIFVCLILLGFVVVRFSSYFEEKSIDIANERFLIRHENTVFKEKMTGIIVVPVLCEFYDCEKREFKKLPAGIKANGNFEFNSNSKNLRVKTEYELLKIEKLKDGKVIKQIAYRTHCYASSIVNDNVYYQRSGAVFRLKGPDYNKTEYILRNIHSGYSISPDEKFIVYYDGGSKYRSDILCIMNLKSREVLALKAIDRSARENYWVKSIENFKKHWQRKKQRAKKYEPKDMFGE